MQSLQDKAIGRDNNFNLLRMIAATAVLISHAFPISLGRQAIEPLETTLHFSLGTLAVLTFFAISGFFVSQSFDRRRSLVDFAAARFLRVYPGLLVTLLVTTLILGPALTTMPLVSYFTDRDTASYVIRNLSLKWLQYDLPGVLRDNPYGGVINGSLWSLFYEVFCYFLVVAIGISGIAVRHYRFAAFLGVYLVVYVGSDLLDVSNRALLENLHRLTLPFVVGMTLYQFRRYVPLNAILVAGCAGAAWLAYRTPWFYEVFVLSWSYFIFCLGYLRFDPIRLYNRFGDYSYGTYIYAFPCEQVAAALWKGISPLELIAASLPATVCCAILSWHLIESPALAHRVVVAGWLERKLARPAGGRVWLDLRTRRSSLTQTGPGSAAASDQR
jgi:peptidoglycan/LPS O-acetylase OafA/YrhL